MKLSQDLFNDINSERVSKSVTPLAEAADAMQEHDDEIEALKEANRQLAEFNTNMRQIIENVVPAAEAATHTIEAAKISLTPKAEATLRHQCGQIVQGVVTDLNIGMRQATNIVTSKLAEKTAEMKTDIVQTIRTESEQATNRFKQSHNTILLPYLTAYILLILLTSSISLNFVITAFNIHLWGNIALTNILWIFFATTMGIVAITIVFFRWWNKTQQ